MPRSFLQEQEETKKSRQCIGSVCVAIISCHTHHIKNIRMSAYCTKIYNLNIQFSLALRSRLFCLLEGLTIANNFFVAKTYASNFSPISTFTLGQMVCRPIASVFSRKKELEEAQTNMTLSATARETRNTRSN